MPEDADKMNEYVVLKDKDESDKIYDLPKEGGIITQKLADLLNVTEGDTIQINGEDQEVYEVEVKGIVEHYFQHYVYMSPEAYETATKKDPVYNIRLLKYDTDAISDDEIGQTLNRKRGSSRSSVCFCNLRYNANFFR